MPDETTNSQPPAAGTGLSRRGFMYGTTAAAAGAMLLGRAPGGLSHRADHVVLPSGHVIHPVGSSGAFTWKQSGPATVGSGSLALSLTGTTAGSLIVATIVSGDANGAFSTTTAGWHLAAAVPGVNGSGRVEIWYFPGVPGAIGSAGGTVSVTFKTSGTTTCRGALTEYTVPTTLPAGSGMIAVLDAPGQNSGHNGGSGPTTLTMTPASGNVGGALGIVVAADFFSSPVSGTWTAPSGAGWTKIRDLGGTVTAPWGAWYDVSLSAGVQPSGSTSPQFSLGGDTDWTVAFAAFRGVVFPALYLDGAEVTNMVALDPTGQELVLAGDVEGVWRSADLGYHWQLSQDGIYGTNWRCTAAVAWSQTVAAEVYACVGKKASNNDGGFMVSTDGGVTWTMRAPATTYNFLNFQANDAGTALLGTEGADEDRSVGHLIAQDPTPGNSFLYVATFNGGIARSPASSTQQGDGFTWGQIGLSDGNHFARALAMDPDNKATLYTGLWEFTNSSNQTFGGLYFTTDANNTTQTPTWNQVATKPAGVAHLTSTVSDVKILGGNVYVTYKDFGVYLYKPSSGTWFTLVSGSSYGLWTSLDVFPSGSNHVVIAACGSNTAQGTTGYTNVVQVTVNPVTGSSSTPLDLTGSANIQKGTIPPDGQTWWHANASFQNYLGGKVFHNPHVLVNPNNTKQLFVTGSSGFFRTDDITASPVQWVVAVNGAPMIACLDFAVDPDPTNAKHFVVCGTDYTFIDVKGDNSGFGATTTTSDPPPSGKLESRAASFDKRPSVDGGTYNHVVYVATNQKFAQNAMGDVQWFSDEGAWHSTGLGTAMTNASLPDNAVCGVYAGNPGSGPYLVAAVIGNGMWKSAIPSNPTTGWQWSQVNSSIGGADTKVQHIPIVANPAGTILYCLDREAGILYRSKNNAGGNWVPIWTLTDSVNDDRSGWLAVNPVVTTADELWVATSQNIWKLAGASSGVVGGSITPVNFDTGSDNVNHFPDGCGGLAFTTTSGTLYAVSLNGAAQTSAQLLSLPNGSTDAKNWAQADPGNSFGSYISWPGPARMTTLGSGATTQTLLVGSNPNLGIYGTVTA